jgi:hypothetical protein
MKLELTFTEEEMISFLTDEKRDYTIVREQRSFDSGSMFKDEPEEVILYVQVLYKDGQEIKVPDEKNHHAKWMLLREIFAKEIKICLLNLK